MIDTAAVSQPEVPPEAKSAEPRKPILRKVGLGQHVALIGARHLQGGILEAWEIKRSAIEWFLLYRVTSPQKPDHATEHERCYGYGVSSAQKAADALKSPPPLRGWSRTSRSFRLDSGVFPIKLFDGVRAEFGEPAPDVKPEKPVTTTQASTPAAGKPGKARR